MNEAMHYVSRNWQTMIFGLMAAVIIIYALVWMAQLATAVGG